MKIINKKIMIIFFIIFFVFLSFKFCNNVLKITYSNSCSLLGDVNNDGAVDKKDAILVAKYIIGISTDETNILCADINHDSIVMINDVTQILRNGIVDAERIQLNATSGAIDVDKSIKLNATIYPDNATIKTVTWKSNNPEVATVDDEGNVKGIKSGSTKIIASTNNGIKASYNLIVNALVNISPFKTFEVNTVNDDIWHTGQGMTTVNYNNNIYYIAAVIQTGTSDKNQQNTHIYILDNEGNIKSIIGDYSFGHANGITSDGTKYLYIYNSETTLYRINLQDYIKNAIQKYNSSGTITENFTENYIQSFRITKGYTKSIYYDKNAKQLYGSNETALYKIYLNENSFSAETELVAYYPEGNIKAANAGLVIWNNYVLKAVLYDYTQDHPYYENIIDIYRINADKTSLTYVTSSKFSSNFGDIGKYEIEDLDIINNDTLVLYYNRSSKKINHIYLINLTELWNEDIIDNRLHFAWNNIPGTSLIWSKGIIDNNGNIFNNGSLNTYSSDFYSVENYNDALVNIENATSHINSYYDSNKQLISKLDTRKIPENATFARTTVTKASLGNNGYDGKDTTISLSKKSIRILFIGNSLTQDGIAYLPYILKNYYPEVDFKIYMWYIGGYSLNQQFKKISDNGNAEIFSIAENTEKWTNNANNTTMKSILATYNFDYVCIQEYFNYYSSYTNLTDSKNVVNYVINNYKGSNKLKFISLLPAPHRTNTKFNQDTIFEITKNANGLMLQNGIVSDIIPNGLALYKALSTELDVLGDKQHLSPDEVHAQEGLPCLLQTYTTLCWLFDELDIQKSIYNSKIRITPSIYSKLNVPGANLGSGVITGNDEQNLLAQEIAINAYKESRQFVIQKIYR